MKIKFDFKKHLAKDFGIYLIAAVSLVVVTSYAIQLKNKAKNYEIFTIVSGASFTESNKLFKMVEENESIKEVNLSALTYNDGFFDVVQSNYSIADILILPEVYNNKNVIDDSIIKTLLPLQNDEFYSESNFIFEDTHYGIKLNDYSIADDYEFTENVNYYLFVTKRSVHAKHWLEASTTDIIYETLKEYLK